MNKLIVIAMLLVLTACSKGLDRKINGSSESSFETSLADIKKKPVPRRPLSSTRP